MEQSTCAVSSVSPYRLRLASHVSLTIVTAQLPELIPQTNMDQQSVDRLREEVLTMSNWIADNSVRLFTSEYEAASQSYIEKSARE